MSLRSFILLVLLVFASPLAAQDGGSSGSSAGGGSGGSGLLGMLPEIASSRHAVALPAGTMQYTAEAGTLRLRDGKAETTAAVFFVAYTADKDPRAPAASRPVTFVFNGGPGASSAYLNLGGLGPRILAMSDKGEVNPPPQSIKDNPETWLAFTDLVFVDPVGTGYSRPADPSKEDQFFGVDQDATSMSAFVRLYLQRAGRRLSPVYLAGESYGGFRAALLTRRLQSDGGVAVSGAILISPALEMSLLRGDDFEPLRWALGLPSMAAVNLERQGVSGSKALKERLADVERYALGPYISALAGGLVSGSAATSAEIARLTGLPLPLVERRFGRISASVFMKEFDRAKGRVLSRYDGLIGAPDPNPASEQPSGPDAVLDPVGAALTSAFVQYVREELGYRTDVTYRILNEEVNRKWDYGSSPTRQGFAGALDDLQAARAVNPQMSVMIAHGYTDLVTPYLAARFLVSQLPPLSGAKPVELEVYEGGHMMYMRPDSRQELLDDARALYQATR